MCACLFMQLLLSPAHEQYLRFMRLRTAFTLHSIPYVLIVHGSGDKTIPLDDSIRLVETAAGPGRSRLEVISEASAHNTGRIEVVTYRRRLVYMTVALYISREIVAIWDQTGGDIESEI